MNQSSTKNNRRGFFLKVILPAILSITLFIISFFAFILPAVENNIMERKREMIRELTNSVWSVLLKYEVEELDSTLTRNEAQQKALAEIRQIRYGEEMKDYFWITDMHPNMLMHPYRSDLEGKSLHDFEDAHGKKLFVAFVDIVKLQDEGYVDYMWQWKDDSAKIVPKLSFVKQFKPWGWIVGTGIYIEDVTTEIKALTKKLIWITAVISFLVALLLLYVSQQSLKIEHKRIEAEKELKESKDKYQTLVEAATDGLVMIIGGKITFSNQIMHKMTGFDAAELIDRPLINLLSENNSRDLLKKFSENIIPEGQYELNIKTCNGKFIEVLATISVVLFGDETVNILILKDITTAKAPHFSVLEHQKLLSAMDVGFFRVNMDDKGRFEFANDTTLQMLGYNNFKDLSEIPIVDIIAYSRDVKYLRLQLVKNGCVKNKIVKVLKKNSETGFVSITLIVYGDGKSKELICDGIIEDVTENEKEKEALHQIISLQKYSSFLMEQPIKKHLSKVYSIDLSAHIGEAIQLMKSKKTDCLLVTQNKEETIGIVTQSDIQTRVLSLNLHTENQVYLIMSSPVIHLQEQDSVEDAFLLSDLHKIHHLPTKNANGIYSGVLLIQSLLWEIQHSISHHLQMVKKAETTDDLRTAYMYLQHFVKPLIESGISSQYIVRLTSSFSDAIADRVVKLSIAEIGQPPVDFSFICMGSEGRMEETLLTDQDNALIYEDVPEEIAAEVQAYFEKLGNLISMALNEVGYNYCKGNIMAKNPAWVKPLAYWERNFSEWISEPEPKNLLEAMIFFDFRCVYGKQSLVEKLQLTISGFIKSNAVFLFQMAHNTYYSKPPVIPSGSIGADKAEPIDLKNAMSIVTMFTRTYCLQNEIWQTNTFQRLKVLREKQFLSAELISDLIFAYDFLLQHRLKSQVELIDKGLPLNNLLNATRLSEIELHILRKVVSIIPSIQNKISADFRIKI